MNKLELLQQTTFGARVAEDEAEALGRYFVETDHWRRIFRGEIDVVLGAKGAGKSAAYFLLIEREGELFDRGVAIIVGENPRGAPAFRDLVCRPPGDGNAVPEPVDLKMPDP